MNCYMKIYCFHILLSMRFFIEIFYSKNNIIILSLFVSLLFLLLFHKVHSDQNNLYFRQQIILPLIGCSNLRSELD